MSYMSYPRITFSGKFQADTSTVNNDPRHFSNADFELRFQDYSNKEEFNGWWNPGGTGIFRLAECVTTALVDKNGNKTDKTIPLVVGNSTDRPSGKLVDLDPDWQLASTIYGQVVTVTDPNNGEVLLQGDYEPYEFRDLWFTRSPLGGDEGASAIFQSVLKNLVWSDDLQNYPVLKDMQEKTTNGMLSIRLTTYGYCGDHTAPGFTYGTVLGAIGPYLQGEPESFINARRFAPVKQTGITNFSFVVDTTQKTLIADLSNALPLNTSNQLIPPKLFFVVLNDEKFTQGDMLPPDEAVSIGALNLDNDFLLQDSGILTLAIPDNALALIKDHPVAFIDPDRMITIREEPEGLTLRAEKFTHRLDPNNPDENNATVTFYAAQYAKPLADTAISLTYTSPSEDAGDCPPDPPPGTTKNPAPTTPTAAVPPINQPQGVIKINPEVAKTGKDGTVQVTLLGPTKFGTPRNYFDGQIYNINYNFAEGTKTIPQMFDNLTILVFSSFTASSPPTWEEIQPILQQYANLYPIMSHGLFDFSDQAQADANARIMHFVFDKNIKDPDYMPVTRDLSYGKRKALLDYFGNLIGKENFGQTETSLSRFQTRSPVHHPTEPRTKEDIEAMKNSVAYTKARKVQN